MYSQFTEPDKIIYLDGPVEGGALDLPLEPLDVNDLGRQPLQDDANVLDRQVRRLLHGHLQYTYTRLMTMTNIVYDDMMVKVTA